MENTTRGVTTNDLAEVRTLGQWTRRYVQSRSVPVLIGLTVFSALIIAMLVLWAATGDAYRTNNRPLLFACGAGLVVAHIALLWLSVPRWGGKWLEGWAWRYYDKEGQAAPIESISRERMQFVGGCVAFAFGACILAHVALGFAGMTSVDMMLPISALYVVPFLTFLFVALRMYLMLLYPFLYGLHSFAVAVGLSDPFASFVPIELRLFAVMWIYGALAVAVSHVYNRVAMSRMAHFGRTESE